MPFEILIVVVVVVVVVARVVVVVVVEEVVVEVVVVVVEVEVVVVVVVVVRCYKPAKTSDSSSMFLYQKLRSAKDELQLQPFPAIFCGAQSHQLFL